MSFRQKIVFPTLILAAAVIFSGCGEKQPVPLPENSKTSKTETLPPTTGKADDVVAEVISETEAEQENLLEEESDAGEALDDSLETNDFGGVYDENEF